MFLLDIFMLIKHMYLRKECSNFTSSNSGHEKCDKNTTLYDKPLLCASLVLCCDQQNNCFPKLSQSAGAVARIRGLRRACGVRSYFPATACHWDDLLSFLPIIGFMDDIRDCDGLYGI